MDDLTSTRSKPAGCSHASAHSSNSYMLLLFSFFLAHLHFTMSPSSSLVAIFISYLQFWLFLGEIKKERGIRIDRHRYIFSSLWPFQTKIQMNTLTHARTCLFICLLRFELFTLSANARRIKFAVSLNCLRAPQRVLCMSGLGVIIGPILDDRLKEKLLKPWKGAHSSHFRVCLSVCMRATEQIFWPRNLIFGLSD